MGQVLAMKSGMAIMAALVLALAGCGNTENRDVLTKQLFELFTTAQGAGEPAPDAAALRASLTPQVLAPVDGPVLLVELPARDAAAVLTRIGTNRGVETFLTPDGISLSLANGLVVATRGLGFDLMSADVNDVARALRGGGATGNRIHRHLDGENQLIATSFVCSYARRPDGQIAETCESPDRTFTNSYLTDSSGNIRTSRQWISAETGYIVIEKIK
ncbi:YjbF family lipoprotein [Yoonia sp. SS1-5]|uniref:YjbF family lipoprotein n=2 Tax=Yoonia rhodophyticola TaxID=3137370 RepID=A0ABZ3JB76_9RHOB